MNQGGSDVQGGLPFLSGGLNLPANFEHVPVRPKFRGHLFQFLVGFELFSKLQPTLGGFPVTSPGVSLPLYGERTT